MIKVTGEYNTAICYTGELESAAEAQIKAVCDQSAFADCKIRMPVTNKNGAAPRHRFCNIR